MIIVYIKSSIYVESDDNTLITGHSHKRIGNVVIPIMSDKLWSVFAKCIPGQPSQKSKVFKVKSRKNYLFGTYPSEIEKSSGKSIKAQMHIQQTEHSAGSVSQIIDHYWPLVHAIAACTGTAFCESRFGSRTWHVKRSLNDLSGLRNVQCEQTRGWVSTDRLYKS